MKTLQRKEKDNEISLHPPEWLKIKILTIPSVGKDMKQLGFIYVAGDSIK